MGTSQNIDVGGLLAGGRHRLTVRDRIGLPAFGPYSFDRPAVVELELEGIDRGLLITGTVDLTYRGACDRCLDEAVHPLHLDVDERIEPAGSDGVDPFAENNVLIGTELDLADLVRQLVDSALPLTLLCTENCLGLCPRCGWNRNDGGRCRCPGGETVEG
jgi:uncharacterized metal-binding protein YceD (DUF177 family)